MFTRNSVQHAIANVQS